jgi:hypothetical protein
MNDFKIHCSQIGKIMSNPPANKKGELSAVCTTYLKEWYAGEREEIFSKYINKGNIVEGKNIEFMSEIFGVQYEKNTVQMYDEFMVGTCDVVHDDMIADIKSPWDIKTMNEKVDKEEIDKDYEWQGRGYMRLWNKTKFRLFYGLQNTPSMGEYIKEVIYDDMPIELRWVAFDIQRDILIEQEIVNRVLQCRAWLADYDKKIKARLGKVIEV